MNGKTALHYFRVLAGLDTPQTQVTNEEHELLVSYLPGAKKVVEIGVFEGRTTHLLAECSDDDAVIYGIDPFVAGRVGISWGELIARFYNRRYLASGKIQFINKLSTAIEVADISPPVDFLFIDGDHSLDGIVADWTKWRTWVPSGGIIALHDTVLTPDKPSGYMLGSIEYFHDHIQHDPDFDVLAQKYSLSVMKKNNSKAQ